MVHLPTKADQIVQSHARLIVAVVKATQHKALLPELEKILEATINNGWTDLVAAIRKILNGQRDRSILVGLDEEDSTIVQAILRGIQNPQTLPNPDKQADPTVAAPGIAHMINQAGKGNVEALQLLAHMAEQMLGVGGDMGKLGGIMRRLLDGERDADKLSKGMSAQGASFVIAILEELGKLELH